MKRPSLIVALVSAAACAVSLAAQSRDAGVGPRPTGTAVLNGRVVRDTSPVARAIVTIDSTDGRTQYQTVTDDDGRFAFERLAADRYLVSASKAGWVTSYYGSPRPGYPPGSRVALIDAGRATIEIPIIPGSVIAGRIVHEDGRPMARQFPWLLESRIVGSRRMLARARMPYDVGNFERMTDDLGEFRLFGLPPGTYYLAVSPSITSSARQTTADEVRWAMQAPGTVFGPAPPAGPVAGYARFFFPGSPDPAAAQPIVVGPGEVRDGLTFRVGFVQVARVSGVVRRPDGSPPPAVQVVMRRREMNAALEGSDLAARTDAEGRFAFQGVSPGEYRVTVRTSSSADQKSVLDLWGQSDLVVSGVDVEGVGIALAPASSITGRISFESTALKPPDNLASVRLQFIQTEAMALALTGAGTQSSLHDAAVQSDGTFRVLGLPPDRYLVAASWPGMRTGDGTAGWWLTTIRLGARELVDAPIDVESNTEVRDVSLTFKDRIGVVEGLLSDAGGQPAPGYFVLAFPADRASWTSTSRRSVPPVRPGTDGRFRLAGLLAGEYYLAVVTAVDDDDAQDPAFLEVLLPRAIKIVIAGGETKKQDLKIGR